MSRIALARWLVGRTRRLLAPLVLSTLARIVNQLLGVALLAIAAIAVARAAAGEAVEIPALLAWLVALALAKALLRYLEHHAGHWVAFTALQRLRELFFARLVPQAPAATQGRAGAELTERATRDIDRIEVFFAHTLPPAVAAVAVPAAALAWLGVAVDARLAATLAPFVAAVLLIPLVASRATWRSARAVADRRAALAARLGDDIQGVREVLALGAQERRLEGLDEADAALVAASSASGRVQATRAGVAVLLQGVSLVALLVVAGAAGLEPGTGAVALAVAVGLWGPSRGVDDFTSGLDAALAAAERVRLVVEAEPAVRDADPPAALPAGSAIELDGVSLAYPGAGRPALDGVTAQLPAGAWSCVVGVSGSGKSTLATLLLRGRDPDAGVVRVGGAELRGIPLEELRRRVALVSQRPTLLAGSIAENLRLARPGAPDDALHEALAVAGLEDWVAGLPRGLDTPVRERGVSVSGGQLQRLALARALVAAPEVLVLDEALSQLDAETARRVRERLLAYRTGLTVIEITHRADLVPDDATVLVLDAGRLVASGTAGELRAADGPFTHLEARVTP